MNTVHYRPPANRAERAFNTAVRWLADHGVNLAGAQTLTVVGRISGNPQRVPVNPLRYSGREYLVAPRGTTQWVRNARADGRAELRRGGRIRAVRLLEVAPAKRPPMIRAYLDTWGWEVARFLPDGMSVDADDEAIRTHVDDLPVFEVLPQ